jgi:hypothetical protein
MQKENQGRKRKDMQNYHKHILKLIKLPHDLPVRILHLFGSHRLIRLKEGKISIIIFPTDILKRVYPVLTGKPMP